MARMIAITAAFFGLLFGLLYSYGFWTMSERQASSSPKYDVKVVGGRLPGVVVESKQAIAGTMRLPVDAPSADGK